MKKQYFVSQFLRVFLCDRDESSIGLLSSNAEKQKVKKKTKPSYQR